MRSTEITKVNTDYAHHMIVTAPLPEFIDSSVKEHMSTATGESAPSYKEVNKRYIESNTCLRDESCAGRLGGAMVIDGQRKSSESRCIFGVARSGCCTDVAYVYGCGWPGSGLAVARTSPS